MIWSNDPLWRALADMRITPEGAALSFAAKLAREQGWSAAHAEAVVEEYRRFLYLGATGVGAVTPSEDVDQAWHLHLSHSRHYWDVLCGSILKRPFHHDPTAGGATEAARHRAQYRATLARYRATFGDAPPAAVWPVLPEQSAARSARIDGTRYWVVPKAVMGRTGGIAVASLLIGACAALAGGGSTNHTDRIDVVLIAGALVIVVVVFLGLGSRRSGKRRNGDSDGGSSCGSDSDSSDGGSSCGGSGCGGGGD